MEHHRPSDIAAQHPDFRRVVWTGNHTQLVVMTIQPGEAIGAETHADNDQILTFTSGQGEAVVEGEARPVAPGDIVVVPAGSHHDFRNTGTEPLVLSTVYGPPDHPDGTVHATKPEADAADDH